MKKIVLATHNKGKLAEYREIFKEVPVELVTLENLGITDEPPENGKTFKENAIIKADFYSRLTGGLPVLAEDSGLEVDSLNGEPGIHSRRWPGYEGSDEELLGMLMEKLRRVPRAKREAQFRVVAALKLPSCNKAFTAEGIMRGYITEAVSCPIIRGLPFRSCFYAYIVGRVIGEMTMEEESRIGHRRQALMKLLPVIKRELI